MKPLLSLLSFLCFPISVGAATPEITVTGETLELTNVVCWVGLPRGATAPPALKLPDGTVIPAQQMAAPLVGHSDGPRYLVFVLPKLKAGETVTLTGADDGKPPQKFSFATEPGKHTDLLFGQRRVLRYVNAPHDPANHFLTFKPFHHVFDPVEGKTLLTAGAYSSPKDGLYPHHRGLFFGFNKITYGDKQTADVWHGTDNVFSQKQERGTSREAGPVVGRERSTVYWHGKDQATFAHEQREVTVYAVPGGTMIDWSTILSTNLEKVRLDGDPQHAGFHFRAAQEVAAKTKAQTYYLRPDGKGKPGETRNWDPKKTDPRTVNLPWNAMSFVVGEKRYTVLRINHPDNPKESRGSERDYGRFGDYFEYDLTPQKPLRIRYRVWVQEGEMTVDQCKALAAAFVHPPGVKFK